MDGSSRLDEQLGVRAEFRGMLGAEKIFRIAREQRGEVMVAPPTTTGETPSRMDSRAGVEWRAW